MPKSLLYVIAFAVFVLCLFALKRLSRGDLFRILLAVLALTSLASKMAFLRSWQELAYTVITGLMAVLVYMLWTNPGGQPVKPAPSHRRFIVTLLGMTAVALATIAWSVFHSKSALHGMNWALLAAIVLLASTRRWGDRQTLVEDLQGIFVGANLTLVLGLVGTYSGLMQSGMYGPGSYQGLFFNPNTTGYVGFLTLFLGCAVVSEGSIGKWCRTRGAGRVLTVAWWLLALLPGALTLVLSGSRTAIAAACVGIVWMVARSSRVGLVATVVIAVGGLVALVGGLAGWIPALSTRLSGADIGTLNGRLPIWQQGLDFVRQQPWGRGWGASHELLEGLYEQGVLATSFRSFHNTFIQVAVEGGVLALLLLVAALLILLRPMTALKTDLVVLGLSGLVVAGVVEQLGESLMFNMTAPFPYLFWTAIGGLLALYSVQRSDAKVSE